MLENSSDQTERLAIAALPVSAPVDRGLAVPACSSPYGFRRRVSGRYADGELFAWMPLPSPLPKLRSGRGSIDDEAKVADSFESDGSSI